MKQSKRPDAGLGLGRLFQGFVPGGEIDALNACVVAIHLQARNRRSRAKREQPERCVVANCCRANMAHTRQSRPDSGHCFQVKVLKTFQAVPSVCAGLAEPVITVVMTAPPPLWDFTASDSFLHSSSSSSLLSFQVLEGP